MSLLLCWFFLTHIGILIIVDFVINLDRSARNIIRLDVVTRGDVSVLVDLGGPRNVLDNHVVAEEATLGGWAEVLQLTLSFGSERGCILESIEALVGVPWRLSIEFLVVSSIIGAGDIISPERKKLPLGFAVELAWFGSIDVIVAEGRVRLADLFDWFSRACSWNVRAVQTREVGHTVHSLMHILLLLCKWLQRAWHSWLHGHQLQLLITIFLASH